MFFKLIILTSFIISFSHASFQKVSIGEIDNHYKNKISEYELRNIINEIEYFLESKLGTNVFDYGEFYGKKINLVYVPPSKLEKRIYSHLKKLKEKEKRIIKIQKSFPKKQKDIKKLKNLFVKQNNILDKRVKSLNDYVRIVNKKKSISRNEYNKVQSYIKKQKTKLQNELQKLKKEESYVKGIVGKHNKNVFLYNNLIREHHRLNSEVEVMSRSFKKVKGMTFGITEIKLKTFYKNGKKVKEKSTKNSMNKIDIYGFDSFEELKTILAHEILHLVGIPHINKKDALMNPIIQKNQIDNFSLTQDDILNFNDHF